MVLLDINFVQVMVLNDDLYLDFINLLFLFNFYGIVYNLVYINNNGNILFVVLYFIFIFNLFLDVFYNMIVFFWGDVDICLVVDLLGNMVFVGMVWYKIMLMVMIVKWEQVGYFSMYVDKINMFQLIIIDGIDLFILFGNNVVFCYGDM